jgi:heptaprenyl diphosphate synthase
LALAADIWLLCRNPHPAGQRLLAVIPIAAAFAASIAVFILIRKGIIRGVMGTSLSGAIAHNVGQVLMACFVLHSPQLLVTYLPFLVGIGAAVGCLTGIVTERVLKALKFQDYKERDR